jgi:ribonuclease III
MDWPVVFRTHSEIEASIVRGLLETHGIDSIPSTGPASSTIFPFNAQGLVEVRVAVPPDLSDEAVRIIAEHRDTVPSGVVVSLAEAISGLERRIGYRFRDAGLLEHALTHKSRAHEDATGGVVDNESLEFLGDAVLGFVIADLLYHEFPQFQEGQKSKAKAALVSTAALADLAQRIGLGDYLLLGRGEEKTGGRMKLALLADGCEAVIAAIYLDGGIEQARAFILRELAQEIDRVRSPLFMRDYKSALQERLQAEGRPLPEYDVAGERGPDHDKRFHVVVRVAGQTIAESEGRTKKEAEQEAARLALEILRDDARR